ncbi:helix-turn-helix domain-containing protein [Mycobacteroides abscessus]|uniref:helix-turn-helix domain-containing protein n=2 Tax=Mycobacteroides abscessus TaxID=36809 RepID=UPI0009A74DDF
MRREGGDIHAPTLSRRPGSAAIRHANEKDPDQVVPGQGLTSSVGVFGAMRLLPSPSPRVNEQDRSPLSSVGVLGSYSKYQFMQLGRVIERVEAAPQRRRSAGSPATVVHRVDRRLSAETIAELVAAFENGASVPDLARQYEVSKRALRKLLRDQGMQMRKQPLSDNEVELAMNLYADGLSLREIGGQLGRGKTTVSNALSRRGVTLRSAVRQSKRS